jgi:hypothetical protein
LHTSHRWTGAGTAEGDGGAEAVSLRAAGSDVWLGAFSFGRTIERYLSAGLRPEDVDWGVVVVVVEVVVVFSSCSEERMNCTRLRRIPAPKMR